MYLLNDNGHHFYCWEDDRKTKWHTCRIPLEINLNNAAEGQFHSDVVDWIYDNIEMCERHARWTWVNDEIQVKFRFERDVIKFALRWS